VAAGKVHAATVASVPSWAPIGVTAGVLRSSLSLPTVASSPSPFHLLSRPLSIVLTHFLRSVADLPTASLPGLRLVDRMVARQDTSAEASL